VEVHQGNFAAARGHFERWGALQKADGQLWRQLGYVALSSGDTARADSLLRLAEDRQRKRLREAMGASPNRHMELAIILSLRGKKEEALAMVQASITDGWRGYYRNGVEVDPHLERLRAEPRFRQMMAEVRAELDRQRERVQREGI
jgi:Flp pilus assembly protein TadD